MSFKISNNIAVQHLMYDGVHPDKVGNQHPNWKRTWANLQDLESFGAYRGLGYYYAVDIEKAKLLRFEEYEEAKEADNEKLVWVTVSCYQGMRKDSLDDLDDDELF